MMHLSIIIASLLVSCTVVPASITRWEAQTPLVAAHPDYHLRQATQQDLDDFVDVYVAAFKPGPIWQYISIDDEKYENYTWTCIRRLLQEQWEDRDPDITPVYVIAVPTNDDERNGERAERVVSIAVWSWSEAEDLEAERIESILHILHGSCSDHLDTNLTRAEDLSRKLDDALEPYLGYVAERHLSLSLLATHPDWDGNGFGAAQVEVGLKKAALADVPVTLLATPAGYALYDSLGFKSIANITVDMLDGLGILWQEYMRWDAE